MVKSLWPQCFSYVPSLACRGLSLAVAHFLLWPISFDPFFAVTHLLFNPRLGVTHPLLRFIPCREPTSWRDPSFVTHFLVTPDFCRFEHVCKWRLSVSALPCLPLQAFRYTVTTCVTLIKASQPDRHWVFQVTQLPVSIKGISHFLQIFCSHLYCIFLKLQMRVVILRLSLANCLSWWAHCSGSILSLLRSSTLLWDQVTRYNGSCTII